MAKSVDAAQPVAPSLQRSLWAGPLVAGVAFGVAYGITQRLIGLNVGELIRFGPGFEVQVFPGTSLESLRLRFGDAAAEVRGDLELHQLEQVEQEQQQKQKQAGTAANEKLEPEPVDPLESAPQEPTPGLSAPQQAEPAAPLPESPPAPAAPR